MIDIDNDGNTSDASTSNIDRECLDINSNFKMDSDDTSMSDTDDSIESRDEEGFLKDPMRNKLGMDTYEQEAWIQYAASSIFSFIQIF